MRRWLLLALVVLGPGCVRILGSVAQPTALERQLLGEYERLDDELVWASSVRAGGSEGGHSFEVLKADALEQRSIQRFNEDDLVELKNEKCITERSDAHVAALSCPLASRDAAAARRVARVVREENKAREVIVLWAAHELSRKEGRASPSQSQIAELRETYARLLKEATLPVEKAPAGATPPR